MWRSRSCWTTTTARLYRPLSGSVLHPPGQRRQVHLLPDPLPAEEQGIPSACEYDIDGVLTMLILSTISGMAPYMGNTMPLVYQNGTIRPMKRFNIEDLDGVEDLTNLYHTSHSTPNLEVQ